MFPCSPPVVIKIMLEDSVNLYSSNSFYTIGFIIFNISIMIAVVRFLKSFSICITVK